MDDENYRFSTGHIPYKAPDIKVDETRELVFNRFGEATSVIKSQDKKTDRKQFKLKAASIITTVLVLLSVYCALRIVFRFTPEKWANENWRPFIIFSLKQHSNMNFYEDFIVDWIDMTNENPNNVEKDVYIEGEDIFSDYSKRKNKYNLYFKTTQEIEELLGDENPHNYTRPELPDSLNSFSQYKAYYCYGNEKFSKWIIIKFTYDRAIVVEYQWNIGEW